MWFNLIDVKVEYFADLLGAGRQEIREQVLGPYNTP